VCASVCVHAFCPQLRVQTVKLIARPGQSILIKVEVGQKCWN